MAVVSTMAIIAAVSASNAAAAARQARDEALRDRCSMRYTQADCDEVCVETHDVFIRKQDEYVGIYNNTVSNKCLGTSQTTQYTRELFWTPESKHTANILLGLILLVVIASVVIKMLPPKRES